MGVRSISGYFPPMQQTAHCESDSESFQLSESLNAFSRAMHSEQIVIPNPLINSTGAVLSRSQNEHLYSVVRRTFLSRSDSNRNERTLWRPSSGVSST